MNALNDVEKLLARLAECERVIEWYADETEGGTKAREYLAKSSTYMCPLKPQMSTYKLTDEHTQNDPIAKPNMGSEIPGLGFFDEQYGDCTNQHEKDNE